MAIFYRQPIIWDTGGCTCNADVCRWLFSTANSEWVTERIGIIGIMKKKNSSILRLLFLSISICLNCTDFVPKLNLRRSDCSAKMKMGILSRAKISARGEDWISFADNTAKLSPGWVREFSSHNKNNYWFFPAVQATTWRPNCGLLSPCWIAPLVAVGLRQISDCCAWTLAASFFVKISATPCHIIIFGNLRVIANLIFVE